MPTLRERVTDIPILFEHFLRQLPESLRPGTISAEFTAALCDQNWSGNVRELRNAVEHAVVMCRGQILQPEHLPQRDLSEKPRTVASLDFTEAIEAWVAEQMQSGTGNLYDSALRILEATLIPAVLKLTGQNRTAAARVLGMDRATLRTRLRDQDSAAN